MRVKVNEKLDHDCLKCFKGNFLKILKSQNGSRILQKALNKTCIEILTLIFTEIEPEIHELMIDSYANYFCQKFYDHLQLQQKLSFLKQVIYY